MFHVLLHLKKIPCLLYAFCVLILPWRATPASAPLDVWAAALGDDSCAVRDAAGCESSFVQLHATQARAEKEAYAALLDIWNGMEISEQHMAKLDNMHLKADFSSTQVINDTLLSMSSSIEQNASPAKYVQVLGLFDTGTNLLEWMIRRNFPNVSVKSNWDGNSWVWKHGVPGAEEIANVVNRSLPATSSMNDVVAIAMVRSPISNIVSLKKAPYNVNLCLQRNYTDMGKPCTGYVGDVYAFPLTVKYFTSTMGVYNSYLRQYRQLKKQNKFRDVLIIKYEDLVLDPALVMQQIANSTGHTMPMDLFMLKNVSKNHGKSLSRRQAVAKLRNRAYLNEFTNDREGLAVLCKDLDRSLVEDITEGSFGDKASQVPYTQDCDNLEVFAR